MKKKPWITKADIEKGSKRVNLTPDILLCEKIAILSSAKSMKPTTYVAMITAEAIEREYLKLKPSELPGQTNLFKKTRGK